MLILVFPVFATQGYDFAEPGSPTAQQETIALCMGLLTCSLLGTALLGSMTYAMYAMTYDVLSWVLSAEDSESE